MSDTGDSLGRSATRGAAATFAGQAGRILVQLAGVVILARMLSPTDYGMIVLVTVIIGVGDIFRDFGLSSAAVQARDVTSQQRTNLFWLNVAIGVALALIFCALSWPIAWMYHDDRLQPIVLALSLTFIGNGINSQFRAHLTRELKLFKLTGAEIIGQLGGLVLAIAFALNGAGYWALVVQQLAQLATQQIALQFMTSWRPGLPRRGVPMAQFIRFGAPLAGVQLLQYASRSVDSLVIGLTAGPGPLGLYNRAFQLMMLPLNQINAPSNRVALPVLSRLQDEPKRFAHFLNVGQIAMMNVVCAIVAFCAAQAGPIIEISLGEQWAGAAPIFQILSIAGIFQVIAYVAHWVFLAKGLTAANLWYSLATRPIMIGLIVLGSLWGVYGVAAMYSLAVALMWPIALWWLSRVSDAPVKLLFFNGLRTMLVFCWAAAASYASTYWLPENAILKVTVGGVALIAAIAIAALVVPAYRRDLRAAAAIRQHIRRGESTSDEGSGGPDVGELQAGQMGSNRKAQP